MFLIVFYQRTSFDNCGIYSFRDLTISISFSTGTSTQVSCDIQGAWSVGGSCVIWPTFISGPFMPNENINKYPLNGNYLIKPQWKMCIVGNAGSNFNAIGLNLWSQESTGTGNFKKVAVVIRGAEYAPNHIMNVFEEGQSQGEPKCDYVRIDS